MTYEQREAVNEVIAACKKLNGLLQMDKTLPTEPAPSPSREGWLERDSIEKWRTSFKVCYTALGHAELDALCDMALSALRPAPYEVDMKRPDAINGSQTEWYVYAVHLEAAMTDALRPATGGEK